MHPNRPKKLIVIFFIIFLVTLSCNAPQGNPTSDLASIVQRTQTALALESFLTQTSLPQTALPTLPPTSTVLNNPGTPTAITPSPQPTISPTTRITQPPDCTNLAKFVDETIPDDTPFNPNENFTKTWTLRNVGTCTWTPDYNLVFANGEQFGGASLSPIGKTVTPNEVVELSVSLAAPVTQGDYQGFWKLATPGGTQFGLGQNGDKAFWVKIVVTSGGSTGSKDLGSPTWVDSFDNNNSHFFLGSDSDVGYEIKDGEMVMTAFNPAGDQWRVAERSLIDNFFLEAHFQTGKACTGEDSYGLIVRAPDQANNFIDSGYVFTFSCAGKFRVYRMDNGSYTGLINWTASGSLKAGANQDNIMGIKAVDENFELYANGKLISSFSDTTYSSGYFGLVIRTQNTSDLKVLVSEIAYWDLQ
jgi:hypothetical protein